MKIIHTFSHSLTLSHAHVRFEDFGELQNLTRLDVNDNKLTSLPQSFGKLKKLKHLDAKRNLLGRLPDVFRSLTELELLDVENNELTTFPPSICCLSSLKKLYAATNHLTSLPENFGNLKSLIHLDLSENKRLGDLPASFAELPNVQILQLSLNSLKKLPDHFRSAPSLVRLLLDGNDIAAFPAWSGEMENLVELSMTGNRLLNEQLHENFGNVSTKLEVFNVAGNFLTKLPESLANLTNLKEIDIGSPLFEPERKAHLRHGNNISHLPRMFGKNFAHLRSLHIDECGLQELPERFGDGLPELQELNAHGNEFRRLPDSFCELIKLKICVLSMNCLEALPDKYVLIFS